jgi:hypothetical protein
MFSNLELFDKTFLACRQVHNILTNNKIAYGINSNKNQIKTCHENKFWKV